MPEFTANVDSDTITSTSPRFSKNSRFLWGCAVVVLVWFAGAEILTSGWYHSQESKLSPNPLPASGEVVISRLEKPISDSGATYSEKEIGDAAMEMLKCSYGRTLLWTGEAGPQAVTTLKWSDRSVVSGVESMHNPGNCLKAAGWTIGKRTDYGVEKFGSVTAEVTQWEVSRGDLQMLAYSAVFRRFADRPAATTQKIWASTRLQPVLDGRRDAPVFILLAYLPLGPTGTESEVHARFQSLMRAIFGEPAPIASVQ